MAVLWSFPLPKSTKDCNCSKTCILGPRCGRINVLFGKSVNIQTFEGRSVNYRWLCRSTPEGATTVRRARSTFITPDKSLSLLFRTMKETALLLFASSNNHYTSVEISAGKIVYTSKTSTIVNLTGPKGSVADGAWHNLTLHLKFRTLQILLDGRVIIYFFFVVK